MEKLTFFSGCSFETDFWMASKLGLIVHGHKRKPYFALERCNSFDVIPSVTKTVYFYEKPKDPHLVWNHTHLLLLHLQYYIWHGNTWHMWSSNLWVENSWIKSGAQKVKTVLFLRFFNPSEQQPTRIPTKIKWWILLLSKRSNMPKMAKTNFGISSLVIPGLTLS